MQAFRIEAFHIAPDANEIQGPDGQIRLNPKAMHVLVLLAEHAGQVVAKQALIDGVWEGVHVGDEVLTNAIYELRKAFGDKARNPRFIQTVHRSGYKLLPNVAWQASPPMAPSPDPGEPPTPLADATVAAPSTSGANGTSPPPAWRRWVPLAAVAAVLATAGWIMAIKPWLCRQPIKVVVVNGAETAQADRAESFLRFALARTDAFEVLDGPRDNDPSTLQIRLVATPQGGLAVEAFRNSKARFLGIELAAGPATNEELSRRVRQLAAEARCLDAGDTERYLESGAMSVDVWRRVRQANQLRRQRRLTPAAEILSDVMKMDDGDVYALERYAHLNQIRGLEDEARKQIQRALDSAAKRGLGRRLLTERRRAELAGSPRQSKELLNQCLDNGADEPVRASCLRMLAWHLNTYERRCNLALGTYDELKKDALRFRQNPDLYLYQAEFALTCGEVEEARASLTTFEAIEGERSRDDAYAMWAWLELLTGHYDSAFERFDFLTLSGDFRSKATYFHAEFDRRRLACDGAQGRYLRLLASEHASERRDALDGLYQLAFECERPVPGEALAALERSGGSAAPFYAPRAWAFRILAGDLDGSSVDSMRAMAQTARLADPVVCSPDDGERPNRLYEEWFCLTRAAYASAVEEHSEARRIHRHIEQRLEPVDKALFRAFAGHAELAAGDPVAAEGLFCRALAWNPRHVQSLAALGELLHQQGRDGEARSAYDRAAAVLADPDDPPPLARRIVTAANDLRHRPTAEICALR